MSWSYSGRKSALMSSYTGKSSKTHKTPSSYAFLSLLYYIFVYLLYRIIVTIIKQVNTEAKMVITYVKS